MATRSNKQRKDPQIPKPGSIMAMILKIFPWKRSITWSVGILLLLMVFSFYGLYTNKFYFFKIDNYIFPIVAIVHFTFLYALWFKIREGEVADIQMRNLEYGLYVIFLIYIFKVIDTTYILTTYPEYEAHVIPATFLPLGLLIWLLQVLLLGLTLLVFKYRKLLVGAYRFDDMNQQIDSWE